MTWLTVNLRSVFCGPCSGPPTDSTNYVPEVRLECPFILIGKSTMALFNRPIMARTQIRVHR